MEFLDLPLREQAAAIAAGDADPSEVLDAALRRIEERNPAVNAIVETFEDESRRMLAEAPRGPLYGVPVTIKDEWPLPWRAERLGAAQHIGPPPQPGESGPYRALRDAGAVIVGVANMHEYGSGSTGHISAYGPARNPWDTERSPGGSSSGPAAAVAARLVAGAVGADGVGLDPLSGRLLRAHRPEAHLRPLDHARPPRAANDHDRLRAAVPRRRRLPTPGRRPVRRGPGRQPGGRHAHRGRPRRALGRLSAGGRRGVPRVTRCPARGHRGLGLRRRDRGPRAHPDRLDPRGADGGPGARDPGADRGAGRGREPRGAGRCCVTGC